MIDLHAHVLPGVDDGPSSLADSLTLLRVMQAQGVQTVVAAVHAFDGRYNVSREALLRAHEALSAALEREGMAIRVVPSMELYLGFDLLAAVKRGEVVGLNGSPHLVVELPAREFPAYTERALFELMMTGYRPLLVHPERNRGIQRNPDLLYRLVERGVRPMLTAASLLGHFSSEAERLAREFLREGAADLIMSDAHDLSGRRPLLPEALAVARACGKADQQAEATLLS
ncbi:MAG: tyrosine-protein phosphatase [Bacillota bacterium]